VDFAGLIKEMIHADLAALAPTSKSVSVPARA
jgi:hypothetical protein